MKPLLPTRLAPLAAACLIGAAATAHANPQSTTVDFSSGTQGWTTGLPQSGNFGSYIDDRGPNAPLYRTVMRDTFGLTWGTDSNLAFIGDYSQSPSVTLSLDVRALSIAYEGQQVSRDLVVELRDYDNPAEGMPYTSVWTVIGTLSRDAGWQHLGVTIGDTSATALPAGWGGYGAEGPLGEPVLPAGRTFANVLAGVDQVVFSTYVPGWFFGFTDYHVVVDNLSISAVPEPATAALQMVGLVTLAGVWLRRRRRAD